MYTYIHIYMHTYITYMHTYVYAYIRIYIHTYIQRYIAGGKQCSFVTYPTQPTTYVSSDYYKSPLILIYVSSHSFRG
jgi:hypothetical protein